MITFKPVVVLMLAATVAVSACARKDGKLMNIRATGGGPDEFAVLPTKPLQAPKNYAVLPEPTPGGTNLTDPTPVADAAKALGGNTRGVDRAGIPAGDGGILAVTTRYGIEGGIRQTLAAEDKVYRSKHRGKLLERLFGQTVYFSAYKPYELDRYAELQRLRRSGVRTPAAPPNTNN